jgi:hypothetical protein
VFYYGSWNSWPLYCSREFGLSVIEQMQKGSAERRRMMRPAFAAVGLAALCVPVLAQVADTPTGVDVSQNEIENNCTDVTALRPFFEDQMTVAPVEYKPLSLWSTIQLGATYFSNAERAKNISYVYAFNPSDVVKSAGKDDLATISSMIKNGNLSIGIKDIKNSNRLCVIRPDNSAKWRQNIDEILRNDSYSNKLSGVKLVYSKPDLFGSSSGTSFFAVGR